MVHCTVRSPPASCLQQSLIDACPLELESVLRGKLMRGKQAPSEVTRKEPVAISVHGYAPALRPKWIEMFLTLHFAGQLVHSTAVHLPCTYIHLISPVYLFRVWLPLSDVEGTPELLQRCATFIPSPPFVLSDVYVTRFSFNTVWILYNITGVCICSDRFIERSIETSTHDFRVSAQGLSEPTTRKLHLFRNHNLVVYIFSYIVSWPPLPHYTVGLPISSIFLVPFLTTAATFACSSSSIYLFAVAT